MTYAQSISDFVQRRRATQRTDTPAMAKIPGTIHDGTHNGIIAAKVHRKLFFINQPGPGGVFRRLPVKSDSEDRGGLGKLDRTISGNLAY